MKLVAVDPGKMTGIAELDQEGHFWSEEEPTWLAVEYLHDQLRRFGGSSVALLVCEAYVISARTLKATRQYEALESIGALRYLAGRADVPFKLVTPAASKRLATDDKLRHLGWYDPSRGGHKNDAARVLLVAALEHGWIDPKEFTT